MTLDIEQFFNHNYVTEWENVVRMQLKVIPFDTIKGFYTFH